MPRKTKEPVFDDDNPEWTKADFERATKFPAGVRLKDLKPGELDRVLRTRGPQKTPTKVAVSIRLSPEVVQHFKAKGPRLAGADRRRLAQDRKKEGGLIADYTSRDCTIAA